MILSFDIMCDALYRVVGCQIADMAASSACRISAGWFAITLLVGTDPEDIQPTSTTVSDDEEKVFASTLNHGAQTPGIFGAYI